MNAICEAHPDGLPGRAVGYWLALSEKDPQLPNPKHLVHEAWDPDVRDLVVSHLEAGTEAASWRGWSYCRFCDCQNGHSCLSDGTFVWPEGLAHYLREHAVRLPDEFVQHVLALRGAEQASEPG